jgi:hypothetical protein
MTKIESIQTKNGFRSVVILNGKIVWTSVCVAKESHALRAAHGAVRSIRRKAA